MVSLPLFHHVQSVHYANFLSCPLMFISTGSSMVPVIRIISLHLLTSFSTGEERLLYEYFFQCGWEAAIELRLKAAVALLLKQMLSLNPAVLLNFAVELCLCWIFGSQRGLLRAWIKEFLGWTGAGSCCARFRSEARGRREAEGATGRQ